MRTEEETQHKGIWIRKHEEQRNDKSIPEQYHHDFLYLLKFADGKFYYEKIDYISVIHQDKYLICHEIISDIFFGQLNDNNAAYTNSSSLAGHHNLDNSGTLIFWHGEPCYVCDFDAVEDFESAFEPY